MTLIKVLGLMFAIFVLTHWLTGGQQEITDYQNYPTMGPSTP